MPAHTTPNRHRVCLYHPSSQSPISVSTIPFATISRLCQLLHLLSSPRKLPQHVTRVQNVSMAAYLGRPHTRKEQLGIFDFERNVAHLIQHHEVALEAATRRRQVPDRQSQGQGYPAAFPAAQLLHRALPHLVAPACAACMAKHWHDCTHACRSCTCSWSLASLIALARAACMAKHRHGCMQACQTCTCSWSVASCGSCGTAAI